MCEENNERVLKGIAFRCLACNRPLNGPETTRTYRNSDELIALCNNCIRASKSNKYAFQFTQEHCSDGVTSATFSDNHNDFWYDWYDN